MTHKNPLVTALLNKSLITYWNIDSGEKARFYPSSNLEGLANLAMSENHKAMFNWWIDGDSGKIIIKDLPKNVNFDDVKKTLVTVIMTQLSK